MQPCESRAQLLNKFPPLTSLHAQVPGNRCHIETAREKKKKTETRSHFLQGYETLWSGTNSGAADDTFAEAGKTSRVKFQGHARCKCTKSFSVCRRSVCLRTRLLVYGEQHILYSSHLLSTGARTRTGSEAGRQAGTRAHTHAQTQRKLKSVVTNN